MADFHYIDILVNAVLAVIMLGVGLSLTLRDFRHIFVRPRALVTGLMIQIVIVPVIAFGIAFVSGLSPEMNVGIVLVSTCASGASSNLITHLVRGNVALAISMTTVNSFLTLVTLPFVVSLAMLLFLDAETTITLPIGGTVLQIFLVTIAPAALGVTIRRRFPRFAAGMEAPLRIILPLILLVVFTVKIFAGANRGGTGITIEDAFQLFPWVLILNILAMLSGYLGSKVGGLEYKNQYTVAIEVGLHNTALALVVAGTIINSSEMEKPALVYATFTFFSALLFVYAIKGRNIFT